MRKVLCDFTESYCSVIENCLAGDANLPDWCVSLEVARGLPVRRCHKGKFPLIYISSLF